MLLRWGVVSLNNAQLAGRLIERKADRECFVEKFVVKKNICAADYEIIFVQRPGIAMGNVFLFAEL